MNDFTILHRIRSHEPCISTETILERIEDGLSDIEDEELAWFLRKQIALLVSRMSLPVLGEVS